MMLRELGVRECTAWFLLQFFWVHCLLVLYAVASSGAQRWAWSGASPFITLGRSVGFDAMEASGKGERGYST